MSAPTAHELAQAARAKFQSLGVVVPTDWIAPATDLERAQFRAVGGEERGEALPGDCLFRAATNARVHHDVALENSRIFGEFIDGISAAIAQAWTEWQAAATLTGVTVEGAVAQGGTVQGPAWKATIVAQGPATSKLLRQYSRIVATTVSDAFREYQSSVAVPGLRWYPDFAEVKAPTAPPTANAPATLGALEGSTSALSARSLSSAMQAALGDTGAAHHVALFDSVAHAVAERFEAWRSATQVCDVMGSGPVPRFAPPAVPHGPVAGGSASMSAGGLR